MKRPCPEQLSQVCQPTPAEAEAEAAQVSKKARSGPRVTWIIPDLVGILHDVDPDIVATVLASLASPELETKWKANKCYGNVSTRQQFTVGPDYTFGGKRHPGQPVDSVAGLQEFIDAAGKVLGCTFGMAHMNKYPLPSIGKKGALQWHADDEKVLDPEVPILGASANHPMRLLFRLNDNRRKVFELVTKPGQVYMMAAGFQSIGEHRVAPLTKTQQKDYPQEPDDVRYSITLRGTL